MTERPGPFESQLAVLRPRPLPAGFAERIGAGLARREPSPWGDRLLLCSMAAGVLAACLIVAVLIADSSAVQPAAAPMVATVPAPPKLGDCLQSLARSDDLPKY
ncbi:MAG: hypothetical protein JWN24_1128 [Phycisphaerales bacterium]|nr:hypothetical protein [Phycisphaerales bacterium]